MLVRCGAGATGAALLLYGLLLIFLASQGRPIGGVAEATAVAFLAAFGSIAVSSSALGYLKMRRRSR
jgi:hypothetical protein